MAAIRSDHRFDSTVLSSSARSSAHFGLTCAGLNASKKSFVFVKLTEQALLAIEQYVQQTKGPSQKPTIQFHRNSNDGAIHIPSHGSGKKFSFALSEVEGPARSSLECIKQSKNSRIMESLGKIRYKLKVQATDEIYEATRAKMTAANNAAKLNATKVIKESGPKLGRKIKVASAGTGHRNFAPSANGFVGRVPQNNYANGLHHSSGNHNTSSNNYSNSHQHSGNSSSMSIGSSHLSAGDRSCSSKKVTRIAHSAPSSSLVVKEQKSPALLTVPSPQSYSVSNSSTARSGQSVSNNTNNNHNNSSNGNNNYKYSSQKKGELKPDVRSRSPSAGLQSNGYQNLLSDWANKPTSPSVPEAATPVTQKSVIPYNGNSSISSINSSHSNHTSDSNGSHASALSPLSPDDRQKLKLDFNKQYAVYRDLYAKMDRVTSNFRKLEEKLKNSVEGSEEWNNVMEIIVRQYEELKKDNEFQETKSRVLKLHQTLAGLKRKIQSLDAASSPAVGENSFNACNRKRFRGDDVIAKIDDNNNDRRAKNLSGALLTV